MQYWLMKTEPNTYSIDDLERDRTTCWEGVRNYQARNFMRDKMGIGDLVLFYHSNCQPPGVAGIAKVARKAYPDNFAQDPKSKYFDPKASEENPTWMMVDIEFVEKFKKLVSLPEIREVSDLQDMLLLKKGMRLSIQPITKKHFTVVQQLGS